MSRRLAASSSVGGRVIPVQLASQSRALAGAVRGIGPLPRVRDVVFKGGEDSLEQRCKALEEVGSGGVACLVGAVYEWIFVVERGQIPLDIIESRPPESHHGDFGGVPTRSKELDL